MTADRYAVGALSARQYAWRLLPAALAATAAGAVTTLLVLAGDGQPLGVDRAVAGLATAYQGEIGRWLAGTVTRLGGGPVLYPVLLLACAAVAARRRRPAELLPLLALAAGQVLELLVFATVQRPAPAGVAEPVTTYSSGHTAAAVLGWGLIAWQCHRWRPGSGTRPSRLLWTVALGAGVLVGASRVYLGLHWFSNAVAGLATGVVLLAAVLLALTRLVPPAAAAPAGAGWAPLANALRVPVAPGGRRVVRWLRGSPWAWGLPALAAVLPLAGLLAEAPDLRMRDFLVYHGAGGLAGAGENLYAFRTALAMPFTYPPFGALVLEPLSRLPLGLAQTLWTVASLAAVVALAATVLRPVAYRIGLPLTVAAMLVTTPVRSHLRFGQVGLFLVLVVGLDLLRRHRDTPGGAAGWGLGLATAVKLTPAVFLPWLVLTRQWRRLAGTLAWLAAATLVGLVLLWPSSGAYLTGAATDTTRFGLNDIPGNQSVRGMLLRVLPEPAAGRAWLAAAAVLAVVGLYQAWRCERAGHRLAAVGVLAALAVAVSPISWVHHLVWLAFPIAALAEAGRWRWVAGWFGLLVVSLPPLGAGLAEAVPALAPLARVVTDLPGLTAVGAVVFLPALVGLRVASAAPGQRRPLVPLR